MTKIIKFADIPQFTREGNYQVNMNIRWIPQWIKSEQEEMGLKLNPSFQRGHVWTEEQQIAWLEFFFKRWKIGEYCIL